MNILITGARGQLGRDCRDVLQSAHALTLADLPETDLTDRAQARELVKACRPDVIVNCAAYTQVDAAEQDHEACHLANAILPFNLAEAAREVGALMIHLSTDYVFDGEKPPPEPYVETDPTNPVSWYGQTKLAGEQAVQETCPRHAILRTAWLYGRHGRNFPKTILAKIRTAPTHPLWIVNDQFGSPTWSWRLAQQIREVAEASATGLFHASSEHWCTWYDFARELIRLAGVSHVIEPCKSSDYKAAARRPTNSILENRALKCANLNRFVPWQEDLAVFVERHGADLLGPQPGGA